MGINWHSISWQEAVKELNSDAENGLSEREVYFRQEKFGRNQLPAEKFASSFAIFLNQLKSPLIYVLAAASIAALFLKEWADSLIIFAAVSLNTAVGYFQELKTSRALRALKKIVKTESRVVRDGKEFKIDSADLVPGDIIVITSGDKTSIDGRLIEAKDLRMNEAVITGEWLPAKKHANLLPKGQPLAERDNMVYGGSFVEEGRGRVLVTAIGKETEMGKIAVLVRETKEERTPLQKKLNYFSKLAGIIIVFLCFLIFFGGILRQKDFFEMFMTSVAVAVAAIPEGLPVAMTVIFALGMQRILKRNGLVRKLLSAETLGSTSVIATDKTGTLTEGKMKVREVLGDRFLTLKAAVLTSEVFVENPEALKEKWLIRGKPTDRALFEAGTETGIIKKDFEKKKIAEIPFNSINKFSAAFYEEKEGIFLYICGAPEKILERCLLDAIKRKELERRVDELAQKGLRIIVCAYKKIQNQIRQLADEINDLVFLGIIALEDPLRPEVKEAILACQQAGIRPIIITGDHFLTAQTVGAELGLRTAKENIIEGKELDRLSGEEFQKRVKDIEIYARVEPRHKLRIVEAWQERGHVVAMTGDGINDAPALKRADIGIALGSGTDVAKEVSDLVLLTDNFNIIVAAIEEGRVIIDNIRKVVTYLLADSFTETILVGLSIVFGLPLPITAAQVLWINLVEDGLPNIALAFEPREQDVLKRKPENIKVSLLTKEMRAIIFIIGIITDLLLFFFFWWLFKKGLDQNYISTMIFAVLGTDSLLYVFSCKNLRKNIWQINLINNKFLIFGVASGFLMMGLAVYLPLLQSILSTISLGLQDWLVVFVIGFLNIILIETVKYYFIRKRKMANH